MENKRIKVLWSMICNSTSTDQQMNTISLFNVIEEVTVTPSAEATPEKTFKSGLLVRHPFEIVTLFSRTEENVSKSLDFEFKIILLDPLGKSLMDNVFPARIEKNKKRLRVNIKINGIKITMEGNYIFKIYSIGEGSMEEELALIPFDVKISKNKPSSLISP